MEQDRIKMNKALAGYHLLMILSAIDFQFDVQEDLVIRDYLVKEFPFRIELDREIDLLGSLHPDEWERHFLMCMDDFYSDSTDQERLDMVQFALDLCKADSVLSKEENKFLNLLFEAWYHE